MRINDFYNKQDVLRSEKECLKLLTVVDNKNDDIYKYYFVKFDLVFMDQNM